MRSAACTSSVISTMAVSRAPTSCGATMATCRSMTPLSRKCLTRRKQVGAETCTACASSLLVCDASNLQGVQDATINLVESNVVFAHDFDELENKYSLNEIIFHRKIAVKYSVKNTRI